MQPTFTLELLKASELDGGTCIDVFGIKRDGLRQFVVTFDHYNGANGDIIAKVEAMYPNAIRVEDLPFIYNGFQLIGRIDKFLADKLHNSEHEFYADLFINEEGSRFELDLNPIFTKEY